MKRLFCLLLAATMLFALCACADKKGKEETKETEQAQQTTSESVETETDPESDLLVTAPDDDKPDEIGTLPIIFGDEDDENDPPATSTTQKPGTTTTKKPTTTTKKPSGNDENDKDDNPLIGGNGNVVETPIIPFN